MRYRTAMVAVVAMLTAGACGGPAPEPGADAGETRTVTHARGTTELVGTPQRVVVLDTGELDATLALGVTPVGAVEATEGSGLQSYLADRVADVEITGTIADPNLEAVAALAPDLILSNEVRHTDIYEELSGIAPTVFAADVGVAWKDTLRTVGAALGVPEEAERLLAEYTEHATATGREFGDPAQVEVSMVRFTGDSVRLYSAGSFIGTLLADAGFARPAAQQQTEKTFAEVSQEQVGLADGDLLFYGAFGPGGTDDQTAVTAGPLWSSLPAVAEGRAHEIPDDLWYLGIGPIAADLVLDDLASYAPPAG